MLRAKKNHTHTKKTPHINQSVSNCMEHSGGTGKLLSLCKISTRLARVMGKRFVKSQKKKSEKPEL